MTTPPALALTGIEKQYRRWATPGSRLWVPLLYRLSHVFARGWPRRADHLRRRAQARIHPHQALHGIEFSLQRSDALGIIGHNGNGKSTLLQIVAGVLQPSAGTVQVNGKVAALLELGSGFNPEMTGRENIGDYIDEPVKTYSSGMALRLAFAVQVHTEPDILIVDEALAVGDDAFQAKAMARLGQTLERLEDGYGLQTACVLKSSVNGLPHAALAHGDALQFELEVRRTADMRVPALIFDIMDGRGLQLTGRRIELPPGEGVVRVRIGMHASFQQGVYRLRTRVVDAPALEQTTVLARQEGRLSFEVVNDSRHLFTGLFPVPMEIHTEESGT